MILLLHARGADHAEIVRLLADTRSRCKELQEVYGTTKFLTCLDGFPR